MKYLYYFQFKWKNVPSNNHFSKKKNVYRLACCTDGTHNSITFTKENITFFCRGVNISRQTLICQLSRKDYVVLLWDNSTFDRRNRQFREIKMVKSIQHKIRKTLAEWKHNFLCTWVSHLTVTLMIEMSLYGLSVLGFVLVELISWTTSIPFTTRPNTVCLLSSHG